MNNQSKQNFYRALFIASVFLLLLCFSTPFHYYFLKKTSGAISTVYHDTIAADTITILLPEENLTAANHDAVIVKAAPPKKASPPAPSPLASIASFFGKNSGWTFSLTDWKKNKQPPPPNPTSGRNPYIPIPQRLTLSHIEGDNLCNFFASNYTAAELLLGGSYVPGKFLPMLDLRGERFDDRTYAASVGVITRIVPSREGNLCQMLGFNVFYDYRQGNIGYYNQVALGVEVLGKRWDFRGNVYVPFGAKRHRRVCVFDDYIGPFEATETMLESVSYSFNAEVGWLAINSQYFLLYFAGGPYYISGRSEFQKTRGGEFRIQPQYKDFIALNAIVSHDPLFNTVYQVDVIVHLPFYLLTKKISKRLTCGLTPRQIYQPVQRFEVMPLGRASCWTANW